MTDDHGLTVRTLRHPKGRLKMVSRESNEPTTTSAINYAPDELVAAVAAAMMKALSGEKTQEGVAEAKIAIAAVRQWDREQRAKIDERLAPSDPDNYGDPFRMFTRSVPGGLTEFKRD